MILPDSNILIDVIEMDPVWEDWSSQQLLAASSAGRIIINHVVVAEVAPNSGNLEDFLENLEVMGIVIEPLCNQSAFSAGVAFRTYRANRDRTGTKTILPDFLIGGHAQTLGATILTRDPRFYRTYFPSVPLITPDKAEP
ncbi:MAG: PIN domain-containing protein [Novosphingobium sp.]